jgi:hypothetical protein
VVFSGGFSHGFLMIFSWFFIMATPYRLIHYRNRDNLELNRRENPLEMGTLGNIPGGDSPLIA